MAVTVTVTGVKSFIVLVLGERERETLLDLIIWERSNSTMSRLGLVWPRNSPEVVFARSNPPQFRLALSSTIN